MPKSRRFNEDELAEVQRALALAEELTGRFYCIPGREWPRYPYEVRTRSEDPGPGGEAFADVVRMVAGEERSGGEFFRERYRIRLHDEAILDAVHDRRDGIGLFPLLVYVLTHELVHVVRFGAEFASFDAGLEERLEEEARVHGITRLILEPAGEDVRLVAEVYRGTLLEPRELGGFSPK
jgi:hypothetical protein